MFFEFFGSLLNLSTRISYKYKRTFKNMQIHVTARCTQTESTIFVRCLLFTPWISKGKGYAFHWYWLEHDFNSIFLLFCSIDLCHKHLRSRNWVFVLISMKINSLYSCLWIFQEERKLFHLYFQCYTINVFKNIVMQGNNIFYKYF